MASSKSHIKDLKRRLFFVHCSERRNLYKFLSNDFVLPFGLKRYAFFRLSLFHVDSSVVRIRNRCIYTYRSRSVYRSFKLSRLCLREFIWKLLLPGVASVSW